MEPQAQTAQLEAMEATEATDSRPPRPTPLAVQVDAARPEEMVVDQWSVDGRGNQAEWVLRVQVADLAGAQAQRRLARFRSASRRRRAKARPTTLGRAEGQLAGSTVRLRSRSDR
jgi:hypothetical protein